MNSTAPLLRSFIREFADPKVAGTGLNGKPAFRDYQFEFAHCIFGSAIRQLMHLIYCQMARQMGKTEGVAIPASAASFYVNFLMHMPKPVGPDVPFGEDMMYRFPDGMQVGIFAPREDTARVDYSRMRRMTRRCMTWAQKRGYDWRFEADNELKQIAVGSGPDGKERQLWYIEVLSAAPASEIESRSFNLIILEECQDIEEEKIVDDILPMGAASRSTSVAIGTIGEKRSWYDKIGDKLLAESSPCYFKFDYRVGIEQDFRDGAYAEHIDREIARFGADSESFRKMYRLERVFERDMLMSEETFLRLADIHERRWEQEPAEFPPNTVLVAGLDIARDYDRTVLKVATADWRNARQIGQQEVTTPRIVLRWQKTYGQKPHDEQFAEILHDLTTRFPRLRKFGCVAFDSTGDRGDYSTKLAGAGFNTIPVIFTAGTKPTEIDDRGDIKPGSKSAMCIEYVDTIDTGSFTFAADEKYMGTVDYYRRARQPKPEGAPILPPSPEYQAHKAEAVTCARVWGGHGRLNLQAPNKSGLHDDQIDADMLTVLAAIYFRPIDLSKLATLNQTRTFAPTLQSLRQSIEQLFS